MSWKSFHPSFDAQFIAVPFSAYTSPVPSGVNVIDPPFDVSQANVPDSELTGHRPLNVALLTCSVRTEPDPSSLHPPMTNVMATTLVAPIRILRFTPER
jgi:hypothetical protein